MKPIIEATNLSKLYTIGAKEAYGSLRDEIMQTITAPFRRRAQGAITDADDTTIWALKDVSFEVQEGEVIGIIGRNGAGKSTLLKILSRITEPTSGRIVMSGRVASLLEVGTGFHPELTGRENIFLNGALLGMSRQEIKARFDEIVAFSEIEKFLDTPVKRYSSGMYVRLAFAVAAHLEPEILIVDEVLAVGDVRFQRKCMDRMGDVSKEGRTVLFVSHSMPAITRLCQKVILMEEGKIHKYGPATQVVSAYLQSGLRTNAAREWPDLEIAPGDDVVRLRSIHVQNEDSNPCEVVDVTQSFEIEITFDVLKPGAVLIPACRVSNQDGVIIFQTNDWNPNVRQMGCHRGAIKIPGNLLSEGIFYVTIGISTLSPGVINKRVVERDAVAFQVVDYSKESPMRAMWAGDYPGVIRPCLPWKYT